MLVYKQFRKFTYEELLIDLADNITLRTYLGLNKLPNYTTLIKFGKKLPKKVLDKLILAFKQMLPEPKKVAIDATGITLDNASPHYCKRIGLPTLKRPFMKTTFVVDIEHFTILVCKMRKNHRHDTVDAKPLIKKLAKYYSDVEILYADRGYDDQKLFKICYETLLAYPLIYQRRTNVPKHRRKGEYRKMFFEVFDYGEYLQRNKIETTNSMFKKRFGSNAKSKTGIMQKVEIFTRIIAFNIDRLIRLNIRTILIFIRIVRVSY